MRNLFVILMLLPALAVAAAPHALVEVALDTPTAAARFAEVVGDLDLLTVKPGSHARLAATAGDLEILRAAGLSVRILVEDMEAAAPYADKGPGFGIYHTWSEAIAFVDSLHLLHPQVVSAKWSLGQSVEGRDIWCFRISDNPGLDESEPEVLIDGQCHAREIMSSEFTLMFAEHLAQGYGVDPEITWLLDNRELYVVPVVNPDGFVYNELIEPDGGGLWRKNRRDNGDGTRGVNLNRNFTYQWGYDNIGSSPVTSSSNYRGPAPGSEAETRVMMDFINGREFRTHDSVHTYANLTLYPWGYAAAPLADRSVYAAMAATMTSRNGYTPISAIDFYPGNGVSFDWVYGAQGEHAKVFSFTNEIGGDSDGFWPPESRRGPLFRENIWPHVFLLRAAGPFVAAHSPVASPAPAKLVAPGQDGLLAFTVQNQSAFGASPVLTVTLASDDPWLQLGAAERTVGALAPQAGDDLAGAPVPFTVDPACPDGHLARVRATVPQSNGTLDFPLVFLVDAGDGLHRDDLEGGTGGWLLGGNWGTTGATSHSPGTSLTDSPGGDYGNRQSTAATLAGAWQATGLTFWHRHDFEDGRDFGRVQVSADGGDWTNVANCTGLQTTWTPVELTLEEYAGQTLAFRFLLESDGSGTADGWYLDDVVVHGLPVGNQPPPVPFPHPVSGAFPPYKLFAVAEPDPDGDPVVCGFRVYADAQLVQLVAAADDVPVTGGTAEWVPPTLAARDYWWRAWAGDGQLRSDLCAPATFTVEPVSGAGVVGVTGPTLRILDAGAGRARLQLGLAVGSKVDLTIFDARGRRVRRLHDGWLDGGTRTLVWDGRDAAGRAMASGVYLARAVVAGRTLTGRVVLLR